MSAHLAVSGHVTYVDVVALRSVRDVSSSHGRDTGGGDEAGVVLAFIAEGGSGAPGSYLPVYVLDVPLGVAGELRNRLALALRSDAEATPLHLFQRCTFGGVAHSTDRDTSRFDAIAVSLGGERDARFTLATKEAVRLRDALSAAIQHRLVVEMGTP